MRWWLPFVGICDPVPLIGPLGESRVEPQVSELLDVDDHMGIEVFGGLLGPRNFQRLHVTSADAHLYDPSTC